MFYAYYIFIFFYILVVNTVTNYKIMIYISINNWFVNVMSIYVFYSIICGFVNSRLKICDFDILIFFDNWIIILLHLMDYFF